MKAQLLRGVRFLVLAFAAGSLISCSDMMPAQPNIPGVAAASAKSVSVPSNLKASDGAKRKISLSWEASKGADTYLVFCAESPQSPFVQVAEVNKTYFDDSVAAGKTLYYKICARSKKGEVSDDTLIVRGSSLAQPLINYIEKTSDGDGVEVSWYMENAQYYQNDLTYELHYDGGAQGPQLVKVSGNKNSYVLEGLEPNKNYKFYVSAYLSNAQTSVENSPKVDAATAQSFKPQPPEVSATYGTSKSEITLSIKLPNKVQVENKDDPGNPFDRPVSFKITRRIVSSVENNPFDDIVSYLSYMGTTTKPASFDAYTPGAVITWTQNVNDVNNAPVRGYQYEYEVWSYIDNDPGSNPGSSTGTKIKGWLCAVPEFDIQEPEKVLNAEQDKVIKVNTTFNAKWEDFSQSSQYKFVLAEKKDGGSPVYLTHNGKELFDTLEEVNSYVRSYDLAADPSLAGTYTYYFYIVPKDSSSASEGAANALDAAEAASPCYVSEYVNLPKADLSVSDGFTDKVDLSWTEEENVTYRLTRKEYGSLASPDEINDVNLTDGVYTDSGLTSGKKYIYTLYATRESITVPSIAVTASTLGTPQPVFSAGAINYDSITAKWNVVNGAEKYVVKLETSNGIKTVQLASDGTEISSELSYRLTLENGQFIVKVERPDGYNNAEWSGIGHKLEVEVESKAGARASGECTVFTLGPAAVTVTGTIDTGPEETRNLSTSSITVSWTLSDDMKNFTSIKGFAVSRVRPECGPLVASENVYYVTREGTITVGGDATGDRAKLTVDGNTYTLTEYQTAASDSLDSWQSNQEKIAWGLPFTYTVLPVVSEDDVTKLEDFSVQYSGLDVRKQIGYTIGYGTDIVASKADYNDRIHITWKPSPAAKSGSTYFANIFYRAAGTTNDWTWIKTLADNALTSYDFDAVPSNFRCNKMEFSVTYDTVYSQGAMPAKYVNSYTSFLASDVDESRETKNSGYLFSLPSLVANRYSGREAGDEFKESILWQLYGAAGERMKGPGDNEYTGAPYVIYMKNTDLLLKNQDKNNGWCKIATCDKEGNMTLLPSYKSWYALSMDKVKNGNLEQIILGPSDVTSVDVGVHNGLMKVLRDPRHYYKVCAYRNARLWDEELGDYKLVEVEASLGEDMKTYAYREVSNEELTRAAMLSYAYTFYLNDGGNPDYSNIYNDSNLRQFSYGGEHNLTSDNGGTASFKSRGRAEYELGPGKFKFHYSMSDYAPKQLTPSGSSVSFLHFTQDESACGICGDVDNFLYSFLGKFKGMVSHMVFLEKCSFDENGYSYITLESDSEFGTLYDATLKFSAPDKSNLYMELTRKGKTFKKNIKDDKVDGTGAGDQRKYWFPMQIHSGQGYDLKTVKYGWWEDERDYE